jgi:hypothetical protein
MRIAPITPTARLSDFGHKPAPATHGHCDECKAPMKDIGGYGFPRYRCLSTDCRLSARKPFDRSATTWTARGFI